MSLYNDATSLKKLFEDNNLFKPASQEDLAGRVKKPTYHVYSWEDDNSNDWYDNEADAIKQAKKMVRSGLDSVRIEVMENEDDDYGDTIWTGGLGRGYDNEVVDDGDYTRAQADEDVKNGVVNEDNKLFKPNSEEDLENRPKPEPPFKVGDKVADGRGKSGVVLKWEIGEGSDDDEYALGYLEILVTNDWGEKTNYTIEDQLDNGDWNKI